ncbi:methyltransferase domain-containing protein [Tychonema sp. LEGE 07199]|uniref:SAM-dependent methyltransferase n=1 Tax=unclassified Tychonema TaxID=2642144 RepID=UPI0018817629|nr:MULTISPECIES: class I SAM-dependent methyltransferase [unclassified Tychonema]MBE9123327.1 methyltransferase domain-containing protein [Tychonema sp. LEGE 07199]MBE9134922.1 methyltransferase domain-containing protein [Tychonema sp. LEGE 07196]
MTDTTLNFKTAPGHVVLAAAGKTMLRPGGKAATEMLLELADFKPGDTVLELAASFGYSSIALAERFGVKVVGVEKNPDSVARARANVAAAGLSDRVEIVEGDILHLDRITQEFDWVLAEAILTMQSPSGKAKILSGIGARLKPGGKFLSHELLAKNRESEIHKALSEVIRVNSTPLSESGWITLCQNAGLQVEKYQTGGMGLLNLRRMLNDEGFVGTVRIVWNVLSRSQIRDRILAMRRVFQKYQQDLGYIIICAQKQS